MLVSAEHCISPIRCYPASVDCMADDAAVHKAIVMLPSTEDIKAILIKLALLDSIPSIWHKAS